MTSPTNMKVFEIDLSGSSVGAYTLTSTGTNQVNYVTAGSVPTSQSGTLNITSNASNKLSGNFTTTLTGSIAMTVSFTDIPVKP